MNPKYSEFIVPFFSSSDVIFVPLYQCIICFVHVFMVNALFIIIIMALAPDSISIWLRYEVKYSMLLRLKESGQASDSAVHGSLNKLFSDFVKCRLNTNSIQQIISSVIFHGWLVKFINVCIMLCILMTPHVHI